MTKTDKTTLLLIIGFGLGGAWLYETFDEFGEWLSNFCVIPPMVFYLITTTAKKRENE